MYITILSTSAHEFGVRKIELVTSHKETDTTSEGNRKIIKGKFAEICPSCLPLWTRCTKQKYSELSCLRKTTWTGKSFLFLSSCTWRRVQDLDAWDVDRGEIFRLAGWRVPPISSAASMSKSTVTNWYVFTPLRLGMKIVHKGHSSRTRSCDSGNASARDAENWLAPRVHLQRPDTGKILQLFHCRRTNIDLEASVSWHLEVVVCWTALTTDYTASSQWSDRLCQMSKYLERDSYHIVPFPWKSLHNDVEVQQRYSDCRPFWGDALCLFVASWNSFGHTTDFIAWGNCVFNVSCSCRKDSSYIQRKQIFTL